MFLQFFWTVKKNMHSKWAFIRNFICKYCCRNLVFFFRSRHCIRWFILYVTKVNIIYENTEDAVIEWSLKVSSRIKQPLPADCLSWLSSGDEGGTVTKVARGNFHHIISVCQSVRKNLQVPLFNQHQWIHTHHLRQVHWSCTWKPICDVCEDSHTQTHTGQRTHTKTPQTCRAQRADITDNHPVGEKQKVGSETSDRLGSLTDPHRKSFHGALTKLNEGPYPTLICPTTDF